MFIKDRAKVISLIVVSPRYDNNMFIAYRMFYIVTFASN